MMVTPADAQNIDKVLKLDQEAPDELRSTSTGARSRPTTTAASAVRSRPPRRARPGGPIGAAAATAAEPRAEPAAAAKPVEARPAREPAAAAKPAEARPAREPAAQGGAAAAQSAKGANVQREHEREHGRERGRPERDRPEARRARTRFRGLRRGHAGLPAAADTRGQNRRGRRGIGLKSRSRNLPTYRLRHTVCPRRPFEGGGRRECTIRSTISFAVRRRSMLVRQALDDMERRADLADASESRALAALPERTREPDRQGDRPPAQGGRAVHRLHQRDARRLPAPRAPERRDPRRRRPAQPRAAQRLQRHRHRPEIPGGLRPHPRRRRRRPEARHGRAGRARAGQEPRAGHPADAQGQRQPRKAAPGVDRWRSTGCASTWNRCAATP